MTWLKLLCLSLLFTKVCQAISQFTPRHGIGFPYPLPGKYLQPYLPHYPYFNKPQAPLPFHPLKHLWNSWIPQIQTGQCDSDIDCGKDKMCKNGYCVTLMCTSSTHGVSCGETLPTNGWTKPGWKTPDWRHIPLIPLVGDKPGWNGPKKSWEGPKQSWDGPKKSWDGPEKSWDGPKKSWDGPKKSWDGPKKSLDSPKKSLDGPNKNWDGPKKSWDGPKKNWDGSKAKQTKPKDSTSREIKEGMSNEYIPVPEDETDGTPDTDLHREDETFSPPDTDKYSSPELKDVTKGYRNGLLQGKDWNGPKKSWDGPKKSWDGPKKSWDGPKKSWDGPKKSWDGPKKNWDGPKKSWDGLKKSWDSPKKNWDGPKKSWDGLNAKLKDVKAYTTKIPPYLPPNWNPIPYIPRLPLQKYVPGWSISKNPLWKYGYAPGHLSFYGFRFPAVSIGIPPAMPGLTPAVHLAPKAPFGWNLAPPTFGKHAFPKYAGFKHNPVWKNPGWNKPGWNKPGWKVPSWKNLKNKLNELSEHTKKPEEMKKAKTYGGPPEVAEDVEGTAEEVESGSGGSENEEPTNVKMSDSLVNEGSSNEANGDESDKHEAKGDEEEEEGEDEDGEESDGEGESSGSGDEPSKSGEGDDAFDQPPDDGDESEKTEPKGDEDDGKDEEDEDEDENGEPPKLVDDEFDQPPVGGFRGLSFSSVASKQVPDEPPSLPDSEEPSQYDSQKKGHHSNPLEEGDSPSHLLISSESKELTNGMAKGYGGGSKRKERKHHTQHHHKASNKKHGDHSQDKTNYENYFDGIFDNLL